MKSVIVMVLVLAACTDDVEVRACNESGSVLTKVEVLDLTDVRFDVGECTEYRRAKGNTYRQMCVEADVGDEGFWWCPIDQLGERPLSGGRWTYQIEWGTDIGGQRTLVMSAVEDED